VNKFGLSKKIVDRRWSFQGLTKFVNKFGSSKKNYQSSIDFSVFGKILGQTWFVEEKSLIADGVF